MADDQIYQDTILDHSKAPRHYGELAGANITRTGINPLCGDEVTLFYRRDGAAQVLQFVSKGCALCKASTSLMLDAAQPRAAAEWSRLVPGEPLRDVAEKFPSRTRCVQLPWETFAQLLLDIAKEKP